MKVYDNIEKLNIPEDEKLELSRHVVNLVASRKDRDDTEKYVDNRLSTDILFRKWNEHSTLLDINGLLDKYPDYKKFNYPDGSVRMDKAEKFRERLLSVIEDDKISFGYLYHALGSEQNRKYGCVEYDCVFRKEEIEYAVDFDLDELRKQIEEIQNQQERSTFINNKKRDSVLYSYNGVMKDKVNAILDNYKQEISETISLFGYNGSNTNQEQLKVESDRDNNLTENYVNKIEVIAEDGTQTNNIRTFIEHGSGKKKIVIKKNIDASQFIGVILPTIDENIYPQVKRDSKTIDKVRFILNNFDGYSQKTLQNAITEYYQIK